MEINYSDAKTIRMYVSDSEISSRNIPKGTVGSLSHTCCRLKVVFLIWLYQHMQWFTLTSVSYEVLGTTSPTMAILRLAILPHILTMTCLVTLDTKPASVTHY